MIWIQPIPGRGWFVNERS